MPMELRALRRRLGLRRASLGYTGRIGDQPVLAMVVGVGTASAAGATARLLDAVDVAWVIVVGIAGAISDRTGDGSVDADIADLLSPDGTPKLSAVARYLLRRPAALPRLARLAGSSRRAAARAADAAIMAVSRVINS